MNTSNKKIYLLIFFAVVLVTIVASVSYGYFNSDLSNRNAGNYTIVIGEDYTLSTDGGQLVEVNVSDADMFGVSYDSVAVNINTNLNITLKNDGSENVTCTYHYSWRWDSSEEENQYTKSSGLGNDKKEFTVTITDNEIGTVSDGNQISNEEKQIPDYSATSGTNFGTSTITASGSETKNKTIPITIKFYNLAEVDQSSHKGKTYKGGVIIDTVSCKKG